MSFGRKIFYYFYDACTIGYPVRMAISIIILEFYRLKDVRRFDCLYSCRGTWCFSRMACLCRRKASITRVQLSSKLGIVFVWHIPSLFQLCKVPHNAS